MTFPAQNLLIGEETPPNSGVLALKIADFGLARVVSVDSLASTQCGSPLYMAPYVYIDVVYFTVFRNVCC